MCVHGRTTKDMYTGKADRNVIRAVKEALRIPVSANGDILTALDARNMLDQTGADGLAVGRGAVGNPFIFNEIRAMLDGKEYTPPTVKESVDLALLQLRYAIEDKGEYTAVTESRKQIALYLHKFRGAAALRADINRAVTYREVEEVMHRIPEGDGE